MKAMVLTAYGSPEVLQLQEVEKPSPKENEILVRNYASSVTRYGDLYVRNFKDVSPRDFTMALPLWFFTKLFFGFTKPKIKILGSEFAGEVEAVGQAVTRFREGDQVFGYLGQAMGGQAQYLTIREDRMVALKPANVTYEEAAILPYGGFVALNLLRAAKIQSGQRVLINGASGSIGSTAVQLAKHYGAEVTGVSSTPRLELVRSLGADRAIDYTQEDFTQNGETYDLILDVLGKSSFSRCQGSLTANGRYLLPSFKSGDLFDMLRTSLAGGKKVVCALAAEKHQDLDLIRELVEAGALRAVIDRSFPLAQAADAHRYIEAGHKKGCIAITVPHDEE